MRMRHTGVQMALDACVYCDCFETGKVKTPPPQPELVYVDPETGAVSLRWDAPGADQHLFNDWRASACEHGQFGELVSHRLGNIALIGFLRALLQNTPERFPTLLSKVLYNGTHICDVINLPDVELLAGEMPAVHALHCGDAEEEVLLRNFEKQMTDLIQAAKSAGKPIVF